MSQLLQALFPELEGEGAVPAYDETTGALSVTWPASHKEWSAEFFYVTTATLEELMAKKRWSYSNVMVIPKEDVAGPLGVTFSS